MSLFARLFGLTALLVALMIPVLAAQEKKDDAEKDDLKAVKKDLKDEPKKDGKADPKKDAKADPKKKDDKKKKTDPKAFSDEDKLVYGTVIPARLASINANSNRQFAIQPVDQFKQAQFKKWQFDQLLSIKQSQNAAELLSRTQAYNQALP